MSHKWSYNPQDDMIYLLDSQNKVVYMYYYTLTPQQIFWTNETNRTYAYHIGHMWYTAYEVRIRVLQSITCKGHIPRQWWKVIKSDNGYKVLTIHD